MKRLFLFFSVLLLITLALANAPPGVITAGDDYQETVAIESSDLSTFVTDATIVDVDHVAAPLMFDMPGLLVEYRFDIQTSTLDVDISINLTIDTDRYTVTTQENMNMWLDDALPWQTINATVNLHPITNRLFLANEKETEINILAMGLSRLDIGESHCLDRQT